MVRFVNRSQRGGYLEEVSESAIHLRLLRIGVDTVNGAKSSVRVDRDAVWAETDDRSCTPRFSRL